MTREEYLAVCNLCLNRKLDFNKGLVCSLTGERAAFEGECADFKRDESVEEPPADPSVITAEEVSYTLPEEAVEQLRLEQKLVPGILAAVAVGLVGAVLWGIITVVTLYQIGYMAIAIGAGVGFAMRYFGKGIDKVFGIMGAIIALFSCVAGNFLSIIGFIAQHEGLGYIETLFLFNYAYLPAALMETFSPIDVLFYGLALFQGYKFSFRTLNPAEVHEILRRQS